MPAGHERIIYTGITAKLLQSRTYKALNFHIIKLISNNAQHSGNFFLQNDQTHAFHFNDFSFFSRVFDAIFQITME